VGFRSGCSLLPLPPLRVGIPNAVGEQPIQIGKVWCAVDEEAQAFAIFLARPLASPRLPSRIIGVEVWAPERRSTKALPVAVALALVPGALQLPNRSGRNPRGAAASTGIGRSPPAPVGANFLEGVHLNLRLRYPV
jgi:hypothetical protein